MSLRARLLAAAAAVALLALVAADLTTYESLRTFLRNQVRASLESSHVAIEQSLVAVASPPSERGPERDAAADAHAPKGQATKDDDAGTRSPAASASSTTTTTSTTSTTSTTAGSGASGGGSQAPIASPSFCVATAALAPGTFVEVRTTAGAIVGNDDCPAVQSGGNPVSPLLPVRITGLTPSSRYHEPTVYFTAEPVNPDGPQFEVRASMLQTGSHRGDLLVLAQSLGTANKTLGRLALLEVAVSAGALVIAILVGWLLVGVGMRPLRRVERTARAITRGELSERVPDASIRTEVGQLGLAMNTMAASIERAFAERDATEAELRTSEERLQRFVADAAHELRTPIAAMSAYAELFERADARGADLPRIMHGVAAESRRMGRLVEDLLLLARLDEHRPVARVPVELVDLASGALETARMVGPQWPVRLEASGAVEVLGDPTQLRQVLDNLLGNVRAHTPAGTPATVRVAIDGDAALLVVADEGPGVPSEVQARMFERFYRADPSRSRASGGAGLGLSIVASIVVAHGGEVSVASHGAGTTFTVRLPRRPSDGDLEPEPGGSAR